MSRKFKALQGFEINLKSASRLIIISENHHLKTENSKFTRFLWV